MKLCRLFKSKDILVIELSFFLLLLVFLPRQARAIMEVRTELEKGYRIDYINEGGEIVVNEDKGYATLIATIDNDYTTTEFYYDNDYAPISVSGYFGKRNTYCGESIIKITYLGIDNQPIKNNTGYAIVHRVVDKYGNCIKETYHDEADNPIALSPGQYGLSRDEFDDQGRVLHYTYLGADDCPIQRVDGFSSAYRIYEDGKSFVTMYFDIDGNPAIMPLGHSGIREIRDDKTGKHMGTTYLDASGIPIINKQGYTTVMYKYDNWNNLCCYFYYGIDGEPVALSRGQYGQVVEYDRKERVRTYFIDKDGDELFLLDSYLGNNLIACIVIAIGLVLLVCILPRKYCVILLCIYIMGIFYITLWVRENGSGQANLDLFWSYKAFFTNKQLRNQIIMNIC